MFLFYILYCRKVCSAFGWSLERTDLQYVFDLNEPCFVSLEPIPDSGRGFNFSNRCFPFKKSILKRYYLQTWQILSNKIVRKKSLILIKLIQNIAWMNSFVNLILSLDDVEIRLRVTNLWVGWPKEHKTYAHPRDIPVGMFFFLII